MLSGSSLRACAELCGVSLKTSWFMRMRLCGAMARAAQPFRTGEAVSWQAGGAYLSESLKGNRSRSAPKVPRGAHGCVLSSRIEQKGHWELSWVRTRCAHRF